MESLTFGLPGFQSLGRFFQRGICHDSRPRFQITMFSILAPNQSKEMTLL